MTEAGLSSEAREITCVSTPPARVAHLTSSDSSTMLSTHNHKENLRHNNALLCLVSLTSISWTGWRRTTYHWQLPSSCYINSLRQPYRPTLTHYHSLSHQRVSFVLRLRQSFPEDCARLKLSSARASQAGLKEMMTRRRVRGCLGSRTEETTLYYSYLGMPALIEVRTWNEAREITYTPTTISAPKGACCPSLY